MRLLTAVLLACVLLAAKPGIIRAAETEVRETPAAMEVSALYGDMAKLERHIPLSVTVYGQSEKTFSGTVLVKTLENTGSDTGEVFAYEYPVTAAAAEKKTLPVYVTLGQRSTDLTVSLVDAQGETLDTRRLSFDIARERGQLLIGTLSDRPERLSYLDGVSLDYGLLQTKVFPMDSESFPADARGLELLDMLVITDFASDRLTDGQQEALLSWVRDGGTLLFGTGVAARETLGGLGLPFLKEPAGIPRYETVDFGAALGGESSGEAKVGLYCVELAVKDGQTLLKDGERALLQTVEYGSGRLGFFAYDPGDLAEFAAGHPASTGSLFTGLFGEDALSDFSFYGVYGDGRDYWTAQSLVSAGDTARLPDLPLYAAALIGYLLLAGPGLYLFLRKKALSRYYGLLAMGVSLVCAAGIYLLGVSTRFPSEFYTCATLLEYGAAGREETTYVNVRTPDTRAFAMEAAPEYRITPLTEGTQWYGWNTNETLTGGEPWNVKLSFGEERTAVTAKRSRAFDSRFFKLMKTEREAADGAVDSELLWFDGRLSGTITNGFSFPLVHAAIVGYGQAYVLEETLAPGETAVLSEESVLTWQPGLSYLLADYLTGGETGSGNALYAAYLSGHFDTYRPGFVLLFSGPPAGFQTELGAAGQITDGLTLYAAELSADHERDGLVYRSGQRRTPKETSGSGTAYSGSLAVYGSDPLTVEYELGSDIRVEKLSFLPASAGLFEGEEGSYLRPFEGDAFFYNRKTGRYDPAELTRVDFSAEALAEYLSEENTIVVQYRGRDTGDGNVRMSLPVLMVTGREA